MRPYMQELANICTCHVSIYANAGLPNAFGGYDDTPEYMSTIYHDFAQQKLATIWGGCCGTTPKHISAMKEAVSGLPIRTPKPRDTHPHFSGLEPLQVDEAFNFVMVGERTNITGSQNLRALFEKTTSTAPCKLPDNKSKVAPTLSILTWMKDSSTPKPSWFVFYI